MKKILLGLLITTNLFGYIREIEKEEILQKAIVEKYNPKLVKYADKYLSEDHEIKQVIYGIYKENEYTYYREYLYIAKNTEDIELRIRCYEKIIELSEKYELTEEQKEQIEIIKKNYEIEKDFWITTK
ncbi:MAG: hypothetical protein ACRCW9_06040 [Cetobacterium sp.]